MRLCKIFGKLHYVFMGNRWQSGKTHGKEEEGERRDHQEVQRADKMSSRSESIMLEIDICPFLASIISWINGNLHCSSCGIWWYLKLNASWGQSSRTSVLSVFSKKFLRFEPVVEPVSWMMESRRNLEADLLDFLICSRKVKKRFTRTTLMCCLAQWFN